MEAVRCDNGRPFFMERLWNGGFPAAGLWSNSLWGGLWGGGFPAAGLWERRLKNRRYEPFLWLFCLYKKDFLKKIGKTFGD